MCMFRRAVCVLNTLLCILLLCGSQKLVGHLPVPPTGLSSRLYESWSGVIRMCVCQGELNGMDMALPWLNNCLSAFEKQNTGVYIQLETAARGALERLEAEALPDIIVFTPNLLKTGAGLVPLQNTESVRPALNAACMKDGMQYALPLCFGGYGLLINADMLSELPSDWETAAKSVYRPASNKAPAAYALQIPAEGSWPAVARRLIGELPRASELLPPDYMKCSFTKAWQDFRNGAAACIPANQWHVRQMRLPENRRRIPKAKLVFSSEAYTDQIFAAAIISGKRKARTEVCRQVLDFLISEKSQLGLAAALMLPARADMRLYEAEEDMRQMERIYEDATDFAAFFER